MALRILWNRDEALILLDGLLSVLNGEKPRSKVIEAVSTELRKRAVDNGLEIDEIFRNTNGISMQMQMMEYIFTDGESGLKPKSPSKVLQEVVTLYKTDRQTYEKLLKEARKLSENKSVKDEYFKWLSGKISPAQLSELYMVYGDIEHYFLKYEILKVGLFETTDPQILKKIADTINTSAMYKYTYRKSLSRMQSAIKYYRLFFDENPQLVKTDVPPQTVTVNENVAERKLPAPNPTPNTDISAVRTKFFEWAKITSIPVPTAMQYLTALKKCTKAVQALKIYDSDILMVTDANELSVIKAKLISNKSFNDIDRINKGKYSSALDVFIDFLRSYTAPLSATQDSAVDDESDVKDVKIKFSAWLEKSGIASSTVSNYVSAVNKCNDIAERLGITNRNLFVVTQLPELDKIKTLLMQDPGFKLENELQSNRLHAAFNKLIAFRMSQRKLYSYASSAQIRPASPKPVENPSQESPVIKNYAAILEKYFSENGFRPNNAIDKARFKKYYSAEYESAPEHSDERISGILSRIGTVIDGRIFPKQGTEQNALISEMLSEIEEAFNGGASAVYVEAVYDRYADRLGSELNIYNIDALSNLLVSSAKGAFTRKHTYFVKGWSSANTSDDVEKIFRASHVALTYDDVHNQAWYIPYDKIRSTIMFLPSLVKVAEKTYFYAPNLPVSADDLERLASLIDSELEYRSHITDSELTELIETKYPSIALDTADFARYGLRNCLGYLLRESFSFNGPIITKAGHNIAVKDVYTDFVRSHETLQYSDLKQLADDMNVVIYWESVLAEMVRINENDFVRKDLIAFDVEAIDDILETVCPEKYSAIKDVGTFLRFPSIGYKWNAFVLESYLFSHSRRFKLLHTSFSSSDVYGAIVRVDSGINDYKDLVVDVLSQSDALGSEKAALEYLTECGFQKKKVLSDVNKLIKEAKLKKEKQANKK